MSIPEIDPIANAARRAKRERLLGENPACVLCGLQNIDALIPMAPSLLEAHHPVGRANDAELTVPACRNCHAMLHGAYADAGVPLNHPPTLLHKLVAVLRAIGAMLIALGNKCAAWAEELVQDIELFDAAFPAWRTLNVEVA